MADEKLYRIGPGSGEWITYDALADYLWDWDTAPVGQGTPTITISKRETEEES